MSDTTLRVQVIETDPYTFIPPVDYEEGGGEQELDTSIAEPAYSVIGLATPGDLDCRVCGTMIGHVEEIRYDTYDNEIEGIVWRWVTVVSVAGDLDHTHAWVLCEDCTEAVTPLPVPAAAPAGT